jgi:hypothetical protein
MYHLNWRKYRQFPLLRSTLLATGRAYLVEASPTDDFWGVGRRLSPSELQLGPCHHRKWGTNTMGNILMRIRQNIVRWQRRLHYPSRRMIDATQRANTSRTGIASAQPSATCRTHAPRPAGNLPPPAVPGRTGPCTRSSTGAQGNQGAIGHAAQGNKGGAPPFSSPPQLPSPTCLRAPASVPLSSDSQRSGQDGRGNVRVDRKTRAAGRYLSPSVPASVTMSLERKTHGYAFDGSLIVLTLAALWG